MKKIILILILIWSTQVYAISDSTHDKILDECNLEDDFFCINDESSDTEIVLKDETKKITAKKEGDIVVFSLQIRDNQTDNITEKIDLKVDKSTIDIARKILKIIQTYQETK